MSNKTEIVEQIFGNNSHSLSVDGSAPLDSLDEDPIAADGYVQWSKSGKKFIPTRETQDRIKPGYYDIRFNNQIGIYFEKIPVNTENLIRFPDSSFDEVIEEITNFWDKEERFKDYGITFKRGILLYGKPGTGKSSLIKLVMKDVISRGGIVVNFEDPITFKTGIHALREIHPDMPVVVVMEDLDSIMERSPKSDILNILDGVSKIEKIVYLATTNYPERLEPRIVNRPSRFDKRFNIGIPSPESRKMYFNFLFENVNDDIISKNDYDIGRWVEDTDGLTISHLHELFVSVVILEDSYKETLDLLSSMKDTLEDHDGKTSVGFNNF